MSCVYRIELCCTLGARKLVCISNMLSATLIERVQDPERKQCTGCRLTFQLGLKSRDEGVELVVLESHDDILRLNRLLASRSGVFIRTRNEVSNLMRYQSITKL